MLDHLDHISFNSSQHYKTMASTLFWILNAIVASVLGTLAITTQSTHDDLAASLDSKAEIYYPGSESFLNATVRWNAALTPQYEMIVKVATEDDVQKTVW